MEMLVRDPSARMCADASEVISRMGKLNERFSGKRVLLTGAAGFLGRHFINYFNQLNYGGVLAKPCYLVAQDSFLRGQPGWLRYFDGSGFVELQQRNVVDPGSWPIFDFVIHAASVASPIFYRKHPIETMDANVIGLRNLLEHARTFPVESFLFFSSSEIYGDPDPANIPTPEHYRGNVSCTGPRACYDESKRFGETLCVNFHQVHGIPVKIARPFNNYGAGLSLHDQRVLPDFFRDILADCDIVLLSDGKATRTFCYITDAISGYLKVLLCKHEGEAFNIGTEKPEISMFELAQRVIKTTGKNAKVVSKLSEDPQYLTDNPVRRCPDLRKSRELLDYIPEVSIEEGLQRMGEFYLEEKGAGKG